MNVGQFKLLTAGYLERSPEALVSHGADLVLSAMNMARKWAERQVNFELSRCLVTFPEVDVVNGVPISKAVSLTDNEPVHVKQLERAFLPYTNGSGWFPIDVISRDAHIKRVQRRLDRAGVSYPAADTNVEYTADFYVVWFGEFLSVIPGTSTNFGGAAVTELRADVVRFLPDYADDLTYSDFLLDDCTDFMLLKTLSFLNFHLKEDERVQITEAVVAGAWRTVVNWNANLIYNSVDETTLD